MKNALISDLKGLKIGVFGGGVSPERSISLISARNACQALQSKGLNAAFIDITSDDRDAVRDTIQSSKIDVAFIALHGYFGEDGGIQSILENISLGYTGSDSNASRLAMDKILSKKIFQRQGIATPDFSVCSHAGNLITADTFPVVVKPFAGGSSLGVSIVNCAADLKEAIDAALRQQDKALLEAYIAGKEISVGILEDKALAVVEIVPQSGYYDFNAKYRDEKTKFVVPAQLPGKIYNSCQNLALAAHKALGCRDFSRVDIRLSHAGTPYVLEVNSIPGLTAHSLLPLCAGACGVSFEDLMVKILHLALTRRKAAQLN